MCAGSVTYYLDLIPVASLPAAPLVELLDQLLPPLDKPMTLLMEEDGSNATASSPPRRRHRRLRPGLRRLACQLKSGRSLPADLVVLAIDVRPETALAKAAGLASASRASHRCLSAPTIPTSTPQAMRRRDFVTDEPTAVPLGRAANVGPLPIADHIFRPASARPIPGALGTAIVRAFTVTAGLTGWSEKLPRRRSHLPHRDSQRQPPRRLLSRHPSQIILKLLWDPADGRILARKPLDWPASTSASTRSPRQSPATSSSAISPNSNCPTPARWLRERPRQPRGHGSLQRPRRAGRSHRHA